MLPQPILVVIVVEATLVALVMVTLVTRVMATPVAILAAAEAILVAPIMEAATPGTTPTTLVHTIIRTITHTITHTIMGLTAHPTMGLITRLPQATRTLTAQPPLTTQAILLQQLLRPIQQPRKLVLLLQPQPLIT